MQSRRRLKSSPLSVLTGKAPCAARIALFFFFFFVLSSFLFGEGFRLPVSFSRCCHHRGFTFVSPLLLFPQWHSDCCVLPSSFPFSSPLVFLLLCSLLPSLPSLPGSVSFTATEVSGQHHHWNLWRLLQKGNQGGKVERDLVCFSALLLPCFACRRIFSYAFSFFSFFFLVFLFFFFLMSWSSLREEAGLLVSLEGGEGGELVPYSSLQECEIWFENGEPSHTLFCLFHSSICARKLCFTPPPSLQPSPLVTCCSTFPCTELVCCVARPLVRMTFVQTWG